MQIRMVSSSFMEGITIEREGMSSLYSIFPNNYFDTSHYQELVIQKSAFSINVCSRMKKIKVRNAMPGEKN